VKNGVKNIQAAAYNGARTVNKITKSKLKKGAIDKPKLVQETSQNNVIREESGMSPNKGT